MITDEYWWSAVISYNRMMTMVLVLDDLYNESVLTPTPSAIAAYSNSNPKYLYFT